MSPLPTFTQDGVLPAGDYVLTLPELAISPLVVGWREGREWDVRWRQTLVENLSTMVGHLERAGVRDIFIDGSFVNRTRMTSTGTSCATESVTSAEHLKVNCRRWIQSGPGMRISATRLPAERSGNYPCGTSIMSSFSRMLVSSQGFATYLETSGCSPPRFGRRVILSQKAL